MEEAAWREWAPRHCEDAHFPEGPGRATHGRTFPELQSLLPAVLGRLCSVLRGSLSGSPRRQKGVIKALGRSTLIIPTRGSLGPVVHHLGSSALHIRVCLFRGIWRSR